MPRKDPLISMKPGIDWYTAGSPGKAPTKNCRHTEKYNDRTTYAQVKPYPRSHFRRVQCPHCGLWALWVLR